MSLTADPSAAMTALRRAGTHGGSLTNDEMRNVVACLLDHPTAAARATAATDATNASVDATSCAGLVAFHFDILDAFIGSDSAATIVAAIATASTAIRAAALTANSSGVTAALSGAAMATSQPAAIPRLDGYDT